MVGEPLIVNTPAFTKYVTPLGKPVTVAFVAPPPKEYVMGIIAVLTQTAWVFVEAADVNVMLCTKLTVIVPDSVAAVQELPEVVML